MGGGDLNMKKSWHPLLMKNQERVWLEEKKALEEKKKLDQLRKELEEERQLQELQRMQEEQTGKKRADRLDWMYNTPATGGGPSQNDLEDYLLGKKRVDKMLIGDEHAKLGAAHKSFIAVQNANTARDTASKIREDPLFAIKQQEQAQYQALVSNPLRLKQLKEKAGIKDKEKKKEKKEKKHKHKHRHDDDEDEGGRRDSRRREEGSRHRDRRSRTRSPSPRRDRSRDRHPRQEDYRRSARSRSRTPPPRARDNGRHDDRPVSGSWGRDTDRPRRNSRSRSPDFSRRDKRDDRDRRETGPSKGNSSARRPPSPRRPQISSSSTLSSSSSGGPSRSDLEAARAARLAAMTSNAQQTEAERAVRLAAIRVAERAELEAEEAARKKAMGSGGKGAFMREQEKMVYSSTMGLEERLKRGRGSGLVRDRD